MPHSSSSDKSMIVLLNYAENELSQLSTNQKQLAKQKELQNQLEKTHTEKQTLETQLDETMKQLTDQETAHQKQLAKQKELQNQLEKAQTEKQTLETQLDETKKHLTDQEL